MKAVEYGKTKERMCKAIAGNSHCSESCPLHINNLSKKILTENEGYNCDCAITTCPEQAVEAVKKWAKENPVKTYLSVLLEKFPNVELSSNEVPMLCPHELFDIDGRTCPGCTCVECWNREFKEF